MSDDETPGGVRMIVGVTKGNEYVVVSWQAGADLRVQVVLTHGEAAALAEGVTTAMSHLTPPN